MLVVVGGWDGNRRKNDVWFLDLSNNNPEWRDMSQKIESDTILGQSTYLTPHSSHRYLNQVNLPESFWYPLRFSVTRIQEDQLVVIGRQSGQRRWSDTHCLHLNPTSSDKSSNNLIKMRWTLENSKVKSRSGHSAELIPSHCNILSKSGHNNQQPIIAVWGGRKSNDFDLIDTKTMNCINFSFVPQTQCAPKGSSYHRYIFNWYYTWLLVLLIA